VASVTFLVVLGGIQFAHCVKKRQLETLGWPLRGPRKPIFYLSLPHGQGVPRKGQIASTIAPPELGTEAVRLWCGTMCRRQVTPSG